MASGMTPRPPAGLCLILAFVVGCHSSPNHDHEHGHEHADEERTESVTLVEGPLELFMEHPYLVRGEDAKFNVHLTVLEDGMPIRSGTLTVTGTGPTGKSVTVVQDAPKRAGIFGPVVVFPESGPNELRLVLDSEQARGDIRLTVTVYADRHEAQHAAEAVEEEEPGDAITFLKEQAWKIGIVHEEVATRRLVERLVVPGEIRPAAGSKAVVTAPVAGRLLPPPGGKLPVVGERVAAGQVVALVEPPVFGPSGAEMLANRAQIQVLLANLDVKIQDAEIDIRRAATELALARIAFDRARSLIENHAIARKEYDEAERDFKIAEAAHEGRLEAKALYERARDDVLALLAHEGLGESPGGGPPPNSPLPPLRLPLKAPLTGTVTDAQVTEGEHVDSVRSLFTVINLDRVWLEARVSEYDLERVVKAPAATFTLGAYPGRRLDVLGEGAGRLVDVGLVVDPDSRTVPVRYELLNPDGLLRVGLSADVAIETERAEEAIAIPESAVVDEDERPTAYVLLDGEHFQKRDLVLGLRDSGFVQVKDGLKTGERVVTKGAYAIRLASVSAVIPAHGHTH